MKISKDAVPSLIDAVTTALEEGLAKYNNGDFDDEDENFDPNDLVLFDSFVLPVLEGALESGFESGEMDQKGFRFMVCLIPRQLNTRSDTMSKPAYGELAKIYYRYTLELALGYLDYIEFEHVWENIGHINSKIESCLLIEGKPPRQGG